MIRILAISKNLPACEHCLMSLFYKDNCAGL
jgi:hypothetical protein